MKKQVQYSRKEVRRQLKKEVNEQAMTEWVLLVMLITNKTN